MTHTVATPAGSLRVLFAPVTTEQARLFGGVARMLDRRGVQVRFAVPAESVVANLRDEWDGLIDVVAAGADRRSDLRLEPSERTSQIGAYDAWRYGWADAQRRAAVADALGFWASHAAMGHVDALIVWNGRDHIFVEAAALTARESGVEPIFMELGPLRREPMTVAITRGGVNAAAEFRRPEQLGTPLTPWESNRLAASRLRFRGSIEPPAALGLDVDRYAFLPLQVDDDTQLFYYRPHFADQEALVRAVVAAMPDDLPLVLKPHPLADERRGQATYEPLLRPQDRIASPRTDTLALIAGAAAVITNNSSAGIEALMLDRPVVVLGQAHYAGRGFTFDYRGDGGSAMAELLRAMLGANSANSDLRDRYLYELLTQELVHLQAHPLRERLCDEQHERLAVRVLDLLRPLELGSDWTPVFDELTALRAKLNAAVWAATASAPTDALLIASPAAFAAVGADAPVAPSLLNEALARPATIRGRLVLLLAPDFTPAQREAARRQLIAAQPVGVHDLNAALARTPCDFHTARFNRLPTDLREDMYRRGEYWDYYLTHSGIGSGDSAIKQTQAATIADAVRARAPGATLEYGCGDGRILAALLRDMPHQSRLTGVDASPRMLSLARERLGLAPQLRLLPGDAREGLRFDVAFDVTVTCGALQHVHHQDLPHVIAELHRVTRDTLLHWEAFEALQPAPGEHYTNRATSRALHRAMLDRFGPVATTIRDVRPLTGQPSLFCEYRLTLPQITVLTLHAIGRPAAGVESFDYRNMFLTPDRFAALLDGLRAGGWAFLTAREAGECLRGHRTTPHKAIVLTFDDGYASVHEAALPIMQARGIRGAAFIATDYIGATFSGNTRFGVGPPLPMMSADQLRSLRDAGWDVGAHSCSHPLFSALDEVAARRELLGSRTALKTLLGECPTIFAFPYGEPGVAFSPAQVPLARECGFDAILTMKPGFLDPAQAEDAAWPRIGVGHDTTPAALLDDLARVHREANGWPSAVASGPTLGERVRRVVQQCVKRGVRRIALYGAGQHTARLLQSTPLWPLSVLAILDDDARLGGTQRYGLPVCGPTQIDTLGLDAVLISSDRYEDAIYDRLAPLATRGVEVLRLYADVT